MDGRKIIYIEKRTEKDLKIIGGELEGMYQYDEELGGGACGCVYSYKQVGTDKKVALKRVFRDPLMTQETYFSLAIQEKKLTSEVLGFSSQCVFNAEVYILMPILPVKICINVDDFSRLIKGERKKLQALINILEKLETLHKKNITHGDLTRNFIVNIHTGEAFIVDFGKPSKKHLTVSAEMKHAMFEDVSTVLEDVLVALNNDPAFSRVQYAKLEKIFSCAKKQEVTKIIPVLKEMIMIQMDPKSSKLGLFGPGEEKPILKINQSLLARRMSI